MLKNLSVATAENIGYYKLLKESCEKNNIEFVPLGLGQKWTGFEMKYNLWKDYLSKLPDDEIVMINDAYDVIILDDASVIMEKFKKFNKPIVFSIQKGFLSELVFPKCFDHIICSGNIIGYVKNLMKMINLVLKHKNDWKKVSSDQIILNNVCKVEPYIKENSALDIKQDIFLVTTANESLSLGYMFNNDIPGLEMKNKQLYNENDKPISVLHLASSINGNKYLEYMGYDTSDIDIKVQPYKFTQLMTYIKFGLKTRYLEVICFIIFVCLLYELLFRK